jgi:hypothetical protein
MAKISVSGSSGFKTTDGRGRPNARTAMRKTTRFKTPKAQEVTQ